MNLDLHVHSNKSIDSLMSIPTIIKVCKKRNIQGVAITDHNRFSSKLLRINKSVKNFVIIPGEEISTNIGHIIGLFIHKEIRKGEFFEVIDNIREQDGLVVFAHPFKGPREKIEKSIIENIDLMEVFNARMKSNSLNLKALEVSHKFNIPVTAGTDAHYWFELGRAGIRTSNESFDLDELKSNLEKNRPLIYGKTIGLSRYVLFEMFLGKMIQKYKKLYEKH